MNTPFVRPEPEDRTITSWSIAMPSTGIPKDEGAHDAAASHPSPEGVVSQLKTPTIEEQLAFVISSAREVAIVAEELLREFAALEASSANGQKTSVPHAIVLAPRLLSATQQQLTSLLAMMRTI
jgi:hypothetical protein